MRKFLSILCILVALFALCSCEPEIKKSEETIGLENLYTQRRDNLNFHDAPFKNIMNKNPFHDIIYNCPTIDERFLKSETELENIPIIVDSCSATNNDKSQLYVLAREFEEINGKDHQTKKLPDNYCLLLVYNKISNDITVNYENNDQFYKWENNYYYKSPILAYYFKIAEPKYAFATEDNEIGMALEIVECWDISKTTNLTENKKESDILNGFVYFAREVMQAGTVTKETDSYSARTRVFRYIPMIGEDDDGNDCLLIKTPNYIYMQYQNTKDHYNIDGIDTFNKDGETKEGWNTGEKQVALLLELSFREWPEGNYEFEYSIIPELDLNNATWINPLN